MVFLFQTLANYKLLFLYNVENTTIKNENGISLWAFLQEMTRKMSNYTTAVARLKRLMKFRVCRMKTATHGDGCAWKIILKY